MNTKPTPEQATAAALASQALLMACLGLEDPAHQLVTRLHDVCGAEGVLDGMLVWADTFLGLAGFQCPNPEHDHGRDGVALSFIEVGTDRETGADEVPANIAWAGRFIAARAARDVDQQAALFRSLPPDPAEQGSRVWALLHCCAMNLVSLAEHE